MSCGDCLLLALQSQSLEHATIFRVELVFHMDFARRHIDEKIIRMRIDVGDVGMPSFRRRSISRSASALYSITTFKNSVFFASKSPSMASIMRYPRIRYVDGVRDVCYLYSDTAEFGAK